MSLTGPQFEKLEEAILSAFSADEFRIFLKIRLDLNLRATASLFPEFSEVFYSY